MVERDFADGTRIVFVNHPSGTSDVLLQLGGRQVSRVVIVPMQMRIGAAVVRMDGIGGVGTEEEFRNRGYSRRVMETAVQQMQRGDAALSTLFGIQDFYQKFGYETTGPEYTVVVPLADAAAPFAAGVAKRSASELSSSRAARAPVRSPAARRISTCAGSTLRRYTALSVGARHDDLPGSVAARLIDSAAAATLPWASRSNESAGSVS